MATKPTAVVVFFALVLAAMIDAQEFRAPATPEERARARQVRDSHGIQAAAALYGQFVQEELSTPDMVVMNVRALAEGSELVVVATVVSDTGAVSADGKHITTEYRARVQRALKSPNEIRSGTFIDVSHMGGEVVFPDGSRAKGWSRDLRRMEPGRSYLLFLTSTAEPAPEVVEGTIGPLGRFIPTMGAQGVYEVDDASKAAQIIPMGSADSPAAHELSTLRTATAALTRVQQAVDSLPRQGHVKP